MKKIYVPFLFIFALMACKKEYKVERTIEIDAPKEIVWEQIKYFKNWTNWSPWIAADPNMALSYNGTDGDIESSYSWESKESGAGTLTNTGLTEGEELKIHIDFTKPWPSKTDGLFKLSETENGKTTVSWQMFGVNKGITSLFLNMDKMVGPDFEKGLALLKAHTEKLAANQPKPGDLIKESNFAGASFIGIKAETDIAGISNFFATSFEKIMATGIEMKGGYPSGIYYTWDMENMKTTMAAAIPVLKGTQVPAGTEKIEIAASKALVYDYYGDYENMSSAHDAINAYMTQNGYEYKGPVIEEYVTDPMTETDPSKWLTRIYYLVK